VKPIISRAPFPGATTVVLIPSGDGAQRNVAVADADDVDQQEVRGR
jgi:hypothetical protein